MGYPNNGVILIPEVCFWGDLRGGGGGCLRVMFLGKGRDIDNFR